MKFLFFKNQFVYAFFFLITLLSASSIKAAESAHEHGVGQLSIAVENHEVEIELSLPGADAVGFEHPPSSKSDHQAVKKAVNALRDVNRILTLSPEAKCSIKDVKVTSGLMEDKKDAHDHDHGHKHKHKRKRKRKHKHDHKHKHEDKEKSSAKEVHSEFEAHYHFVCKSPKNLTGLTIGFFKVFPSAHELKAKWITPRGQGGKELTSKSKSLTF